MKNFFTLLVVALLSFTGSVAQRQSEAMGSIRYIVMTDGQVVAIPERFILDETFKNGVCTLSLEGDTTFVYSEANVASVSDSYDVTSAKLLSFSFAAADNDQVYKDVAATITEDGDKILVTADVPVIGKRLRPSFTLSDGATLWLDGVQQVSGQSSQRYTAPVVYTIAQPKHWIYDVAARESAESQGVDATQVVGEFKPFGRTCEVNVRYLTDFAAGEFKIPTVYITFGDGVTWDDTQWIGQTLVDEEGNSYNTKEEWIKDCTFRLDGAGVWPDIETVEGCEVRGRGNSSWSWSYMSKNPYRIKFPKKAKQSPFNLTEDRQWVFIANKQRGSMLSNSIAQKIAAMVDGEALCHMIPVDLYVNGHYRGSYCFTEKIGIADNSVAIDETTGCLLELDSYYDEDYKFRDAAYSLPVNVKDPDFGEEDEERVVTFEDVQASVNAMTSALATGGDITEHIDMESWAKFWLVNDLVRNVETYHPKSCYLFNENPAAGELWKFGPAWDFDWAFGYEESYSYYGTGAQEDIYSVRNGKAGYEFYNDLRNTEAGKRAYYKEWLDFVAEGRLQELQEYIEDYVAFASASFTHNNSANVYETDYTDYTLQVPEAQQWVKNRAGYIFNSLTKYDDISSDFVIPEDYGKPVEALIIDDALHADFLPAAGQYAAISYIRSMTEGSYGTIVLPFAPDAASLENYAFYALVESGDGFLRFEEVAEPAANTPYLYSLRSGKENAPITCGPAVVSNHVETQYADGWETVGSFVNKVIDTTGGNYYSFSSANGEVNRVTKSLTVLPYRAYFKNMTSSKSSFNVYVGGTTCVLKISGDDIDGFGSEHVYDVYGRRVLNPVKGEIYIVNGKKVIY